MNDKYTQKAVFTNRREVALLNVLLVKQKTEEKTMTTYDIWGGGLYAGWDGIFSRDYALPSGAIKHDLIVRAIGPRCSQH